MSAPAAGPVEVEDIPMTHRQRIEALVGLLLGMFVAFLSSTIVSNALPTIITDLHGTQNQYTWVVVATLLASTATTPPIWGKFADLVSKKLLVQMSLALFTIGSVLAGTSQSVDMLIGFRVIQGLGLGGLQALVVIVVATMFSPRERGRYQGPMAAVMSVATVAGPLIGGLIVDTSWLGWRWTFYVCVPLAVAALLVIQRTLNLPRDPQEGQHRLRRRCPHRRGCQHSADLGDPRREELRLGVGGVLRTRRAGGWCCWRPRCSSSRG